MSTRSAVDQVRGGFRKAGLLLLGFAWLGLVFGGLGLAFSAGGRYPPSVGWALLAIAAAALIGSMDRWVKVFPGLLALATLNAIGAIFTGHATGSPSVRVSAPEAAVASGLLAASTVVSLRFGKSKCRLRIVDRVAVFTFVFCVFWTAVDKRVQIIAPALAFGLLLLAWGYDRFEGRHGSNPPVHARVRMPEGSDH